MPISNAEYCKRYRENNKDNYKEAQKNITKEMVKLNLMKGR